ncbi:hypothetical protein ACEPPN_005417 [Leptodophora sp. 'Broadleaf-Isolate-01']
MKTVPVRYFRGIKDLHLLAAFGGTVVLSVKRWQCELAPISLDPELRHPSGTAKSPERWQQTVSQIYKAHDRTKTIRDVHISHMYKCKSAVCINELFDLVSDSTSQRIGLQIDQKKAQIMPRIEFMSRVLAAARQRIATLICDVKAALASGPPKPTPNPNPEASITSLEKDRYDILLENLKLVQSELETEKSKAVEAATSSLLEVEKLRKTSDTRIEALELELASAHAKTWEIAKNLSAEVAKHLDTKEALKKAKSKILACKEHNQTFGPKYKLMKESDDADQAALLLLRTSEQAHEMAVSELGVTRDKLATSEQKQIAAEAEVERMKKVFARFAIDIAGPSAE